MVQHQDPFQETYTFFADLTNRKEYKNFILIHMHFMLFWFTLCHNVKQPLVHRIRMKTADFHFHMFSSLLFRA